MKPLRNYIVQAAFPWGWNQSMNKGANGVYTKAAAIRRAKTQASKSIVHLRYRVKKLSIRELKKYEKP
jgi:hypothetical protein